MKRIALIACSLFVISSSSFALESGDVLQIKNKTFNARTSIYFKGKNNLAFILTNKDVAEISDVRILPSGNKALRIGVISGPNTGKKAWIYYNIKDPQFDVFSASMDSFDPIEEVTSAATSIKRPKVEVERITSKQDEATVKESKDLIKYDQLFLTAVKKHEQEMKDKAAKSFLKQTEKALNDLVIGKETKENYCADCQDFAFQSPLNDITFEKCSTSNNDFEPNFKSAYDASMSIIKNDVNSQEFSMALKCINGGMQGSMKGTGGFYNCPSPKSFLKEASRKASTRPCLSKSMVGSTAAEIFLASKCLDMDLKSILPLLHHESRFIPNVKSVTGAGGIGQLTGVAIKEINRNLNRITSKYGKKPGCEYLKDIPQMHSGFICSRMHVPTNPRQNVVFSMIYQKLLRDNKSKSPRKSVNTWLKKRTSPLTKNHRDQIEEMLLRTSYNSGPGTVLAAFNSFAASPRNRNLPYTQFMKSFSSYLRQNVRAEAANYNDKVLKDLLVMEKKAGIKCSI